MKTLFYWKRGCIKMRKHMETFHANKGYKLAIVIFVITSLFSKQTFVVQISKVICTKTRACTPLCCICKWITSTLSFIWHEKIGNIFSPWGPVFPTGPFFPSEDINDQKILQSVGQDHFGDRTSVFVYKIKETFWWFRWSKDTSKKFPEIWMWLEKAGHIQQKGLVSNLTFSLVTISM